jgi:hypothetical protein
MSMFGNIAIERKEVMTLDQAVERCQQSLAVKFTIDEQNRLKEFLRAFLTENGIHYHYHLKEGQTLLQVGDTVQISDTAAPQPSAPSGDAPIASPPRKP